MHVLTFTHGIGYDAQHHEISEVDQGSHTDAVRSLLVRTFGGYAEVWTQGGWIAPDGYQIVEQGLQYTVYTDRPDAQEVGTWVAGRIAKIWNQQSVVFAHHDAKVLFVEQDMSAEEPAIEGNEVFVPEAHEDYTEAR